MSYIGVIGIFIELITVVVGFMNFSKFKNTIYAKFIYLLLYVTLNEILAFFLATFFNRYNEFLFNIYDIVTVLFYLYFYKAIIKNTKTKKLIIYFEGIFISSYLLESLIFKLDFIKGNASYAPHIGSIMVVIVLILFLFEIINNEKIVFNLYKSMIFWISIGLLLFYVGSLPIFISREVMNFNITYKYILLGLGLIMYGSFTIGFILSKKKYNYLNNGKS